jgi:hypothetical protein
MHFFFKKCWHFIGDVLTQEVLLAKKVLLAIYSKEIPEG